ncbi:LysR family transcriptional regulator [Catellatospora methionotrophica]|uniref:LysR family transcriptional regulator n=1 Tax=Catellatospora methionotrophica TaxID=121620 RepID=A0A8J3LH03_9ACTN|nr:LysR family transcriptional regulator [Catellatospora methionotrophica]GIG18178.1 LysR family transcriptional regulator [Catellatospora methionotrophica]
MELRDIEIFLVLAQELHFGRTAERLHVTPARVSQAIKKQERRVGAALFDRTSRSVTLTPLGEQLRADLAPAFQSLHEGMRRASAAAHTTSTPLRVGVVSSNAYDLRPYWQAFRDRHHDWALQVRHAPFHDCFDRLRSGDLDLLVVWLPVEEPDLTVGPVLFTEPRVLLAAADHPLADRTSVTLEALADVGVLGKDAPGPDYWVDAFLPFATGTGRTIERLLPMSSLDEMFTHVSNGDAVHSLGAHTARYHSRPDIAYVPITDGAPLSWGLVWHTASETASMRAFVRLVSDLGPMPIKPTIRRRP